MDKVLRWGIVSAGKISHDFVAALSTLSEDEHKVIAVAAKDIIRAESFAKEFNIPKSYQSYEELALDIDVDIIYIGIINTEHFNVGMLMLEHNKHVLCEKPLCMNERQSKKLIMYAEQKKLFLMEAVWSRCFPVYQYLKKQISSGVLGTIKEIDVTLGFDLKDSERLHTRNLGGGSILDLGVYCIQLSQWVFDEPPLEITAEADLNTDSVDIEVNGKLHYTGGGVTNFKTSTIRNLENFAIIKGSNAQIKIKQFWCPTTVIDIDGTEKTWTLPDLSLKTNFINSVGLSYEANEVRKCILARKIQSDLITHNDSLLLAQIEDKIRKKIGVIYEADIK